MLSLLNKQQLQIQQLANEHNNNLIKEHAMRVLPTQRQLEQQRHQLQQNVVRQQFLQTQQTNNVATQQRLQQQNLIDQQLLSELQSTLTQCQELEQTTKTAYLNTIRQQHQQQPQQTTASITVETANPTTSMIVRLRIGNLARPTQTCVALFFFFFFLKIDY